MLLLPRIKRVLFPVNSFLLSPHNPWPQESLARPRSKASLDLAIWHRATQKKASPDAFQKARSMLFQEQQREESEARLAGSETACIFQEKVAILRSKISFRCASVTILTRRIE
jgi:hypothetical protein